MRIEAECAGELYIGSMHGQQDRLQRTGVLARFMPDGQIELHGHAQNRVSTYEHFWLSFAQLETQANAAEASDNVQAAACRCWLHPEVLLNQIGAIHHPSIQCHAFVRIEPANCKIVRMACNNLKKERTSANRSMREREHLIIDAAGTAMSCVRFVLPDFIFEYL